MRRALVPLLLVSLATAWAGPGDEPRPVPGEGGTVVVALAVYPRFEYTSPRGPGVVRFVAASTHVGARYGETVQIALTSTSTADLMTLVFWSGGFRGSEGAAITVTPKILR